MLSVKIIAPSPRRGIAAVYTILMLVALFGLVSMGVDLGRVQLAKTELRGAADAAARSAARGLGVSVSQAQSDAIAVAAANSCDGVAVALDSTQDIEFGSWDSTTRIFTVLTGAAQNSADAVRITARRVASRGTAIPLVFARLAGRSTCDINAVAVATVQLTNPTPGFVSRHDAWFDSNAQTDSYNSAFGPYSTTWSPDKGSVYSNEDIVLSSNAVIRGDARPGPGDTATGGTVTGSRAPQSSTTSYPDVDPTPYGPGNNNNSVIPGAYIDSERNFELKDVTWNIPPGVYYFKDFRIMGTAQLVVGNGPVFIYVTDDILFDTSGKTVVNRPQNLQVRSTSQEPTRLLANSIFVGQLYAPQSDITIDSNAEVFGSLVGESITVLSNARLHYDESLTNLGNGSTAATAVIRLVK